MIGVPEYTDLPPYLQDLLGPNFEKEVEEVDAMLENVRNGYRLPSDALKTFKFHRDKMKHLFKVMGKQMDQDELHRAKPDFDEVLEELNTVIYDLEK